MGRAADAPAALEEVDRTEGQLIRVTEGEGINLQCLSKIQHTPSDVYAVLTDPASASVFRSIVACTERKVLEEDRHRGRRKLQISHRAVSRFLFINVTFETHLYVWEDDRERSICFQNAREGFMKRFEGRWDVRTFTQHSLDLANLPVVHRPVTPAAAIPPVAALDSPLGHAHHTPWQPKMPSAPAWLNPAAVMQAAQRMMPSPQTNTALVTLEQHIHPKAQPPAPIKSLIRRLVSKQLADMLDDLRAELDKRARARMLGRASADAASTKAAATTAGKAPASASAGPAGAPALHRAAPTASMTASHLHFSHPLDLWAHCEPLINITIEL